MNEEQEALCRTIDQRMRDQAALDWAFQNRIDRPIELCWEGKMYKSVNFVATIME